MKWLIITQAAFIGLWYAVPALSFVPWPLVFLPLFGLALLGVLIFALAICLGPKKHG